MHTKIVATIGPASFDTPTIKKMVKNGMGIARINTKYGSEKEYTRIIKVLKPLDCELMFDIITQEHIEWLRDKDFDYIAMAFTESAEDIERLREKFAPRKIKVISKIESAAGLENLEEIIKASEGIMVARGDLGKNLPLCKLPFIQKEIIKRCRKRKTFVITATEMLMSMTKNRIPVRAEVSDVANAVLDGTDAVMLSEESALGKHPAHVVKVMAEIIHAAEMYRSRPPKKSFFRILKEEIGESCFKRRKNRM